VIETETKVEQKATPSSVKNLSFEQFLKCSLPAVEGITIILKQVTSHCYRVNFFKKHVTDCISENCLVKSHFVEVTEDKDGSLGFIDRTLHK
jgi:hypothetical protein